MLDHYEFAVVIDHVYELSGQKKLAVGLDGRWHVWTLFDEDSKPTVKDFGTEQDAKLWYDVLLPLQTGKGTYTPHPVPHLVRLSDPFWGRSLMG